MTDTTTTKSDGETGSVIHHPRPIWDNPLHRTMGVGESAINDVYAQVVPAAALVGPPGIGKSTLGKTVAARHGDRWNPERPGTKIGLIECILDHRHDRLLPLDDIDWFWDDSECRNILKVILEVGQRRFLSHTVGGSKSRKKVEIHCGLCFLSNRDFNNPKAFKRWEDVQVVLNRMSIVQFSFDALDAYEYTGWVCSKPGGMLSNIFVNLPLGTVIPGKTPDEPITITKDNRSRRLPLAEANDVLAHFAEHARRYPSVSPRTVELFARRRVGRTREEWERVIAEDMLKEPAPNRVFKLDGKRLDRLHTYQIEPTAPRSAA